MEKEKKVSLFSKIKGSFFKSKKSVFAMLIITLGNVFTLAAASIAWFCAATNNGSVMSTFSGDLDVNIQKVSAYKYIYPYHKNSTEFIDYTSVGQVKSYVVKDASITEPTNMSTTMTITLGKTSDNLPYVINPATQGICETKVLYDPTLKFRFYLVGDKTFTGVTEDPWSTTTATAFNWNSNNAPTANSPALVSNVVVSAGAEFIFFTGDNLSSSGGSCKYYTYTVADTTKTYGFSATSSKLKCLKSGIYTFKYYVSGNNEYLDITLTSRNDNAIIGTNLVDPTKITIDYRGSNYKNYENIKNKPEDLARITSLNTFLPYAIQEQKTMVVLDVELKYQNKLDIDAGLNIVRNAKSAQSIDSFSGKYNTTHKYTFLGVEKNARNPLNASDFYAFRSVFTTSTNAYNTPTDAWNAFHTLKTDYQDNGNYVYQKFNKQASFDESLPCNVTCKENGDSTLIQGATTNYTVYHMYIAIDYDYEYMRFFVNQDRVGKTYYLDRDFQFYFTATQRIEAANNSSSSSAPASSSSQGGE